MENFDSTRPQDLRSVTLNSGEPGSIIRIDADGNCLFRAIVESCNHSHLQHAYIENHEILRIKVSEELRKSEYLDLIKATLSDEKNVPINSITQEEVDSYIAKMALSGTWGGTPELHVIAKLLKVRIIIHQNGINIKIPPGNDYDEWPQLIELVHEEANNGIDKSTDLSNNNHYNLALPKRKAEEIIKEYIEVNIQTIKELLNKCPHPDSHNDESKNFRDFFFTYDAFLKTADSSPEKSHLRDKTSYHLEMLWKHLLHEFMSPMWSYDEKGYNDNVFKKYRTGKVDTIELKNRLKLALKNDELKPYFNAFQYVKDLLFIDEYLYNKSPTQEEHEYFRFLVYSNYLPIIRQLDNIHPLLSLREHLKLMQNQPDFDSDFYKRYFKGGQRLLNERKLKPEYDLLLLSLFIETAIPNSKRNEKGFKKFDWEAFHGLGRCIFKDQNNIAKLKEKESTIAKGMEILVNDLILYTLGQIEEEAIRSFEVSDIAAINASVNDEFSFEIIDNYTSIVSSIHQDNQTARLATLRAISAIGEALNSVKLLMPQDQWAKIKVIKDLRDHIVHSATLEAHNYLKKIIEENDNNILPQCLAKMRDLKTFCNQLKTWFDDGKNINNFPKPPDLKILIEFEREFAAKRKKDEKDEKLSLAHRLALINSLPESGHFKNTKFDKVNAFLKSGPRLSRTEFAEACPNLSATEAKKMHEKIDKMKKVHALQEAINKGTIDFNKISLNVSKENENDLANIKMQKDIPALKAFLLEHEKKINLSEKSIEAFLLSIEQIDIKHYKQKLKKFAEGVVGALSRDNFQKAIRILFKDKPDNQKLWEMSYELLLNKKMTSLKRFLMVQINQTLDYINRLKEQMNTIFDGKYVNTKSNLVVTIACEMLYGFCLDGFKKIKEFLGDLYDYQDLTLYHFAVEHPIEKIEKFIETAIAMRNEIFHFEGIYHGNHYITGLREVWFRYIQNLTHGTLFPEAIIISDSGLRREAIMSKPEIEDLKSLKELIEADLERDENRLNVSEAEISRNIIHSNIYLNAFKLKNIIDIYTPNLRSEPILRILLSNTAISSSILKSMKLEYIKPEISKHLLEEAIKNKGLSMDYVNSKVYSEENLSYASKVARDAVNQEAKSVD